MMIDDLKRFVNESHVGLEVSKLDVVAGLVPMYALYNDHCYEVYRGNVSDIIAFVKGCRYTIDLYEGR